MNRAISPIPATGKLSMVFRSICLLSIIACFGVSNLSSQAQRPDAIDPSVVNLQQINWGPAGGGNGFPVGVRTARQGVDSSSGGVTYYALFPAGSHFDLHRHTHDEYVVVVAGNLQLQLGDKLHTLEVGSYVVIPGSLKHSWTVPKAGEDAIILVRRAGPADFEFIK